MLSKPVDELVNLLGLEVPLAPEVSLADIKADGVLLHWKLPDQRGSVLKYMVRINGIDRKVPYQASAPTKTHTIAVGDVSSQETSITIENLQPDHHYVIRIVTLSSANFQAPSNPIRVKTLPASSGLFFNAGLHKENTEAEGDGEYTPTPVIRPNKNLLDIMTPAVSCPVMTREHSNSMSRVRRTEPARRNSPASQTIDQARSAQEAADSSESIKELTEKLDALRREIDDIEKQIAEEEEEFQTTKATSIEKKDEKKQALKEKEDASRDLRKEVASLERANTAAQARKTQQEKLLRQKEDERKKLKEDVARWRREIVEFVATAKEIEAEQIAFKASTEETIQRLKEKHSEELQTNKSLEEEIRVKGTQVKLLEEERKQITESSGGNGVLENGENVELEEDRRWALLFANLQQRYAQAYSLFAEAERANQMASERLQYLETRRASQPALFGGMTQDVLPTRRNSQRVRPVSMREHSSSGAPGGFVHSTAPPFNSSIPSVSPTFGNAAPYFNMNNGMALPLSSNITSYSQAEIESLTGGAPMSPTTAGDLLPSGLLGDDTDRIDSEDEDDPGPPQGTGAPSPTLDTLLPGLGAPGAYDRVHSPSSPVSLQSPSPSIYASPRESAGHLSYFPATGEMIDSDKRSIRSTSSSLMAAAGHATRFSTLFGLSRQRGKTTSDQGPPLGTLKPSQSQSLPRQDPGGLDPIGRRRGSHSGGAWYDAFKRSSKPLPAESSNSPKHVTTRKRPFNMFGSKGTDPWLTYASLGTERPSSPRPASTKSTDITTLPRPSTETQTRFGWPVDSFGTRSNTLGPDWSMGNTSSWSRMQSRRPSIQHGSAVSLVHDDLLMGDTPDFPSTRRSPTQAPIGTRPQSSASHMSPAPPIPPTPPKQLNPAAPNFKSLFNKKSEEDKAKRAAEKAAEKEAKEAKKAEKNLEKKASRKDKGKGALTEPANLEPTYESTSPLGPRRSRDNRSISTADESIASPRESLERALSQSDAQGQGVGGNRETFMQKLSRKSSSSQFLPFGKGKGSLFSKKNETVVSDTDEDANLYAIKTAESATSSPSLGPPKDKTSALSWSSIKRIGKRGDKTPSLHESIASETTGDEEDDHQVV